MDARFETYGTSHLAALALCVVGIVGVVWLGRRIRGTDAEAHVGRVVAIAILVVAVPLQILQFLPDEWNPRTSLPFQLCDLAWMFAVHALWTRSRLTATVTYLWGITLTTQAMITPDLASDFPEARYLMFWAMHLLIIWAAFYLVLGLRILPTWATYWRTVAITAAWAVAVFIYNSSADANYGYVNAKPESASILDLLGPWPLYIVVEIAIIAAVWALLTWPCTRARATLKA
ncbi:TIGR02206 family membrane protein [Aeromicrobium sp.]|uniref:YwaF family protein n=1 Tax=Aeromicrobium sp. TaxID=1871063 RepID=UPI003D6B1E6B